MNPPNFSPSVVRKLGFYVYIYIDPRDGGVFYVGKGRGNRAFCHLDAEGPAAKVSRIAEIRGEGLEPLIEILVHGLEDEETALKIEAAVIDLMGRENLTNEVRGYQSRTHGRMRLNQIHAMYAAKKATIEEPSILIRINQMYRHTMTPQELYEATRICWKVGRSRTKVRLAMAVYHGVVREVYEIQGWFPAGSTFTTRQFAKAIDRSRWEFVGRIADDAVRRKYVHRSVADYFPKSSQNPIQYVNVNESD